MRISRRRLFLGSAATLASAGQAGQTETASGQTVGRRFTGESLREIAFPLGGIGTGTVSLGGYGNLRDWEIFNRPSKNSFLPFTFAALRLAGSGLKKPVLRVLERELLPPYQASHGIGRERGAGLARFREVAFFGAYPFATLIFEDARLPVAVWLEAFNPMIPLDTERSSLPVAILAYRVQSRSDSRLDAALAFSITNPIGYDGLARLQNRRAPFFGQNLNEFRREQGAAGLFLSSRKYGADSFRHGSLAVVTDSGDLSYRLQWEHGAWWDELQLWWQDFRDQGRFPNNSAPPSEEGYTEYASMARHFSLEPGEAKTLTFVLGWRFPNVEDYWTGQKPYFFHQREDPTRLLMNDYGARWESAWEPAAYALRNLASLRSESLRYRDSLYSSTLPPEVIDAVSSQASILRTNTVMVMKGEVTLAFEGCGDDQGCCPMNCTHVYNYEQALAHLYPDLERSMRETDFLVNLRPDGYMSFRTATPLQEGAYTKIPAADGQMGCILKLYREWLLSGDDEWLRKLWPKAKKALEYAWVNWDADRDGVMEGEQHNTYDIRFYGPNTMIGTLYLGALAAAAKMASHLGDKAAAESYERLFRDGSAKLDRLLWNGEYYIQKTDPSKQQAAKYQYGDGCLSDQLLGQWFAEIVGLGKLLPLAHLRDALRAVYRYNFREDFRGFSSAQRIYALNDEKGLVNCSWPRGNRPAIPFGYCDEVWTGVEYEVAAHLVYEGMVKEGVRIVRAVRDRHDGIRRNPWDETECGHHYARAMSSWSLLTAFSGCCYSASDQTLAFRPRTAGKNFRCLFSTGTSWGSYSQRLREGNLDVELRLEGGALELRSLRLSARASRVISSTPAGIQAAGDDTLVLFRNPLKLGKSDELRLSLV